MSFICPNCGTEVDIHSLACPECGSDERTGWSENTLYDDLDLPDEAFDDRNASPSTVRRRNGFLALVGLLLLLIFVLRFIFGV